MNQRRPACRLQWLQAADDDDVFHVAATAAITAPAAASLYARTRVY